MKNLILLFALFIWSVETVFPQVPAFPGAEGGGMYTTGGRGGKVYYVNTLEDNMTGNPDKKEGSFRWCLEQDGTKTILFKISGTIHLQRPLRITKGDLTIAGQSAPGDGICIGGHSVSIDADNVIIRFLRFRVGDDKLPPQEASGTDGLGGRKFRNVIIDHCSISWSTDECSSFYDCRNFTLQWSIISESLRLSKHPKGPHGYGGIWGGTNSSFHHNLLAHHDSRNPRLGPSLNALPWVETIDIRNNVIYNWVANTLYGGEAMNVNIVNNYYKQGPATPVGLVSGRVVAIDKDTRQSDKPRYQVWGRFFIEGNIFDRKDKFSESATQDNWNNGVYNQFSSGYGVVSEEEKREMKMDKPFYVTPVTTHSAKEAYEKVLDFAGASFQRDEIDRRIVKETRTGTATFIGKSKYNGYGTDYPGSDFNWKSKDYPKPGIIDSQNDLRPENADKNWSLYPQLRQGEVPVDSDEDGIPDGWLETNYPGKKAHQVNKEGYTYLEVYLNSLVQDITDNQN